MGTMLLRTKGSIVISLVVVAVSLAFAAHRGKGAAGTFFTAPADIGSLRNEVNATGVVQAVVTVQVGSQVSGQVEELYADYNSVVKHGQLLAKIDARNFQAQVENAEAGVAAAQAHVQSAEADTKTQAANVLSAQANLEAARVTLDNTATVYQRQSELTKSGIVSKNDYDTAKANADSAKAKYEQAQAAVGQAEAQMHSTAAGFQQAKAQLQQAQADLNRNKLNLEYCNIFSPVDGVVISRNIDVGQTIAASLQSPTLFTIANDLSLMQVNANVDEADIGNISDQAGVRFTVDAYPNDVFSGGRISEIRLSPQTVQNVVTYSVIIGIDNPELKLKPGMTTNITITVDQRDHAVKIPNAALRYTPPGVQREQMNSQRGQASAIKTLPGGRESVSTGLEAAAPPLAPGQKWNPATKIKTVPPQRTVQQPAVVYVLNALKKPEPRHVVLGITDGSATEVVSGEVKPGDLLIIGDSTQGTQPSNASKTPNAPSFLQQMHDGIRGGGPGRGM